jgi:hypothetical protein
MRSKSGANRTKKQARLSLATDRRLKDYSLAAAGVGALALAAPAHAAITSTSPSLNIPADSSSALPVPGYPNGVRIANYLSGGSTSSYGVAIYSRSFSGTSASFFGNPRVFGGPNKHAAVKHKHANVKRAIRIKKPKPGGDPIGPASVGQIVPTNLMNFGHSTRLVFNTSSGSSSAAFLGNQYLGFSVTKAGVTHYGWINLSISQTGREYNVTVNQIAIENCPAQPITIGQSTGGANCSVPTTPAPNSLWLMSLGVAGLAGLEALRRLRRAS